MISYIRPLAILSAVAFILHLIWERLHIQLYTGYEALEGILPVYMLATFGDVMYTLLAVLVYTLLKRDSRWFLNARAVDFACLALIGLGIAIFVEYKAMLLMRWEYLPGMPLIFGYGLSPLVQMTVLLPTSVYITTRVERYFRGRISS